MRVDYRVWNFRNDGFTVGKIGFCVLVCEFRSPLSV